MRGRNIEDSKVEGVDVEDNGELLSLPSKYPAYAFGDDNGVHAPEVRLMSSQGGWVNQGGGERER